MKTIFKLTIIIATFLVAPQQVEAQFIKKLLKKADKKIEREADKRAERRVNENIDEGYDEIEDVIDGKKSKKQQQKNNQKKEGDDVVAEENSKEEKMSFVWNKFDFVPGDTIIFEDGPSIDEENGEFPSRWDLVQGNAEIASIDGKNVIFIRERFGTIIPYLKNANEDYLPEIFTIEFDLYFEPSVTYYELFLWDKKNQSTPDKDEILYFKISVNKIRTNGSMDYWYPNTKKLGEFQNPDVNWRHISLAFTNGKLKIYMDDTRLINIPHFEGNPTGLTIEGSGNGNENEVRFLKDIRIAQGGVKYYNRVLSEGKIIVNGIRFDTNKATLKPESMGPINNIYKLMSKNSDLNFSIEGHTDSDGVDDLNMELSKKRGKVVMDKLISMGIDRSRLKSNGFGESKPIDNNNTSEGKANNRRVEFVKF